MTICFEKVWKYLNNEDDKKGKRCDRKEKKTERRWRWRETLKISLWIVTKLGLYSWMVTWTTFLYDEG